MKNLQTCNLVVAAHLLSWGQVSQVTTRNKTTNWAIYINIEDQWEGGELWGLLNRDIVGLPCVVWGSEREFHDYFEC